MKSTIENIYGGVVRVRACGVLIENDQILMVKHVGLGSKGYLWIPPGGGVENGSSIEDTIKKEFVEETGLEVTIETFLFVNEFIDKSLHAIEFFYKVRRKGGQLTKGYDPEVSDEEQIIEEVKFLDINELKKEGIEKVHVRFCDLPSLKSIAGSKGIFNFKNIYLK